MFSKLTWWIAGAALLCCFVVPSSAQAQGAYVRRGNYNNDCIIHPKILRPDIVKSEFERSKFERPEFDKTVILRTMNERFEFERAVVLRPEFVRPEFHTCSQKDLQKEPVIHASGFVTAPRFGMEGGDVRPGQLAAKPAPASDPECCGGPILVPSALAESKR